MRKTSFGLEDYRSTSIPLSSWTRCKRSTVRRARDFTMHTADWTCKSCSSQHNVKSRQLEVQAPVISAVGFFFCGVYPSSQLQALRYSLRVAALENAAKHTIMYMLSVLPL